MYEVTMDTVDKKNHSNEVTMDIVDLNSIGWFYNGHSWFKIFRMKCEMTFDLNSFEWNDNKFSYF